MNWRAKPERRHFETVAAEVRAKALDAGLWAQCFAEADGDRARAEARYIAARAIEVAEQEKQAVGEAALVSAERIRAEARSKAAEIQRMEQLVAAQKTQKYVPAQKQVASKVGDRSGKTGCLWAIVFASLLLIGAVLVGVARGRGY